MTYMRTTAVHLMQPIAGVLKSTPTLLLLLPLICHSGAVTSSIGPWDLGDSRPSCHMALN